MNHANLSNLATGLPLDDSFPIDKEALKIDWAKQLDHPYYFYDLDQLRSHISQILYEAEGIAKLWYACKANPLSNIIKTLTSEGMNVDIAGPGELTQVLLTGLTPDRVLATGPAKSYSLLERYIQMGVNTFVLESHNQVYWLNQLARKYDIRPNALLRLQLRWDETQSSVLGGNNITPFGLELSQWALLDPAQTGHLNICGVHSFQWGNIVDTDRLATIWKHVAKEAQSLARLLNFPLTVIDFGGGIGIPYHGQAQCANWPRLMKELGKIKKEMNLPEVWLELGRFAVGEFGSYMTKIIDKKNVGGVDILVLDSGINQMARPMLTKQAFPAKALGVDDKTTKHFQIHGPLCTALDHLGDYVLPANIDIGDWIEFTQCGAYGLTESMPYFLCHSLPGEVVLEERSTQLVRRPRAASSYLV